MSRTAKLFTNGRSQAVRLPAASRFEGKEVYIRKDEKTGDVILSAKPTSWDGFFEARAAADIPDDFLSPEERAHGGFPPDPFEAGLSDALAHFPISSVRQNRTDRM